jgi:hypothetical protein
MSGTRKKNKKRKERYEPSPVRDDQPDLSAQFEDAGGIHNGPAARTAGPSVTRLPPMTAHTRGVSAAADDEEFVDTYEEDPDYLEGGLDPQEELDAPTGAASMDADGASSEGEGEEEPAQEEREAHDEVLALRAEVAELRESVAIMKGKHARGGTKITAMVAKPDLYTGATPVRDWLQQIAHYMSTLRVLSKDAVDIAAGFLRGDAQRLWFAHVAEHRELGTSTTYYTWDGPDGFKKCLLQGFDVAEPESLARVKLDGLKQTTTIDAYLRAFKALCTQIRKMGDGERIHRFLTGLKPALRDKVKVDPVTKKHWSTFSALAAYAVRQGAEDAIFVAAADVATNALRRSTNPNAESFQQVPSRGLKRGNGGARSAQPAGKRKQNGQSSDGMKSINGVLKLRSVIKEAMERKLCLNCLKPGHQVAGCTNPAATRIPNY